MKICNRCRETKEFTEFYKKTKTTYRGTCKTCWNSTTKEWVNSNMEQRKHIVNMSYQKNKLKILSAAVTYRLEHPEKALHHAAKCRSNKYGIPFEIEVSDIIIPKECPVFKFPLIMTSGKSGGNFSSPSLDRINPSKGYIKGNIQVISNLANTMKNNASKEELVKFAAWIYKEYT